MNILKVEWERYRNRCYSSRIPKEQEKELEQTFYAGCLVSLTAVQIAAELPEITAEAALGALLDEANTYCQNRIAERKVVNQ